MKELFFQATAGHAKIVKALMTQADKALAPFARFLRQAIHTAKHRQTRYQLPWERVRDLISFQLEPVDCRLRVRRPPPLVVLPDWPTGAEPDRTKPGFAIERSMPFRVETAKPTSDGLQIIADIELRDGEELVWCGHRCRPRIVTEPAPTRVCNGRGEPLKLLEPAYTESDHWLLLVEGVHEDGQFTVDGHEVHAVVMPAFQDLRRVFDGERSSFEVHGGMLRESEPPADELLRGDDDIRYRWREQGSPGRRGCWVQLLPPESADTDEFMDPRAVFCEGDVSDVWTQSRKAADATYKVKRVDQDRYQLLLDRYPPQDSTLYLPVDLRNLYLQRRALHQLRMAPLPHHQGLVRLCEDPEHARWPAVRSVLIEDEDWYALRDLTRDGTEQQRRFVRRALGSPDFAFLEGPPGSGKTTAICELVQQLVAQGQRVLMCASTHPAIDNVLERLLESGTAIDAVRIGKIERVDDKVRAAQLDERVAALRGAWAKLPHMRAYGDGEIEAMAERTIIMAANLTCGTTMGIVNHPLFRTPQAGLPQWEQPICTMPHWDVLIVDEASKTLIQEFMVPALMAKRWIIVGDVHQLPPFADRADIVANLRDLVDDDERALFPRDHQRACLLLFRLLRTRLRQAGMRWLVVEPPGVLDWLMRELEAEPAPGLEVVRMTNRRSGEAGQVRMVSVSELQAGGPAALYLAAADWVLVPEDLLEDVADVLPFNLLMVVDPSARGSTGLDLANVLLMRQARWIARAGRLPRPYRDRQFGHDEVTNFAGSQACEMEWFARHDFGQELAWRITRIHELRTSRDQDERRRLGEARDQLLPCAVDIDEAIAEIEDIGLPSILEVIQEGIGVERARRRSLLTAGMRGTRPEEFAERFESLAFQHRMHPHIAEFPRELIYSGRALRDANTVAQRDADLGWDFGPLPGRRVWVDIDGREHAGVNADEIQAMRQQLEAFIDWVRGKGPPNRRHPRVWEVACLCFYVKQEGAIAEMLRALTGDKRRTRFAVGEAPIEIVCCTVDRFQGREADLVLLSMRNTKRVGFLDSPNRLNVAVTRARQQLLVFGRASFFARCRIIELEQLVERSPRVAGTKRSGRRGR